MLVLVAFAASAAFANTLGNGFAFDDQGVIVGSTIVTAGDPLEALTAPWWPADQDAGRLWRPLTLSSFAAEWWLGNGEPLLLHAVNVSLHAGITLLVVLLVWGSAGSWSVLAGGLLFAVHPVHVEAVANAVGRAELLLRQGRVGEAHRAAAVGLLRSDWDAGLLSDSYVLAGDLAAAVRAREALLASGGGWLVDRERLEALRRLRDRGWGPPDPTSPEPVGS